MFTHIKQTLHDFGTDFDVYTHEDSMHTSGRVEQAIAKLREAGNIYEKDGASGCAPPTSATTRTASSSRATASPAYIAGDIAYFLDKRERGFDLCIYMLGADHHGYIARLKAAAAALGDDPGHRRGADRPDGQPGPRRPAVRMSKRAGTVITLDDLVEAIGVDAARYSLIRHRSTPDRHRSRAVVDGIQREPGLLRAIRACPAVGDRPQRRRARASCASTEHLDLLTHEQEGTLIRTIGEFPRVLKTAAALREPHRVSRYLEDLAGDYHRFYDSCRVLPQGDEQPNGSARRASGAVRGHPAGHRQRPGDPRRQRPGADVIAHPAGPRHAEDIHHGGAPPRPRRPPSARAGPERVAAQRRSRRRRRGVDRGRARHRTRRRVRHAAVRDRRGRLPVPLPRHRRGVRRR